VIRQQFLVGARIVVNAIDSPAVAAKWDQPSVLADQTVGGLAGHLARGAVWVVGEYLDQVAPSDTTFEAADHYFATHASMSDETTDRAVRERGAAVAAAGHDVVAAEAGQRLAALEVRLPAEPADRITVVAGGAMRLDDYLVTRLVEQVVHLDDLARSVDVEPWPVPDDHVRAVLQTGTLIGLRRFGAVAMLRALYRDDTTALPVLR
jgi:hypothetical protein